MYYDIQDFKNLPAKTLGQAYCDLNCFRWNKIFGDEPPKYDKMTNKEKHYDCPQHKEAFNILCHLLTEREQSMYWWTLELGRPYSAWKEWWEVHHKNEQRANIHDSSDL